MLPINTNRKYALFFRKANKLIISIQGYNGSKPNEKAIPKACDLHRAVFAC